jgi:hypothetical protein
LGRYARNDILRGENSAQQKGRWAEPTPRPGKVPPRVLFPAMRGNEKSG